MSNIQNVDKRIVADVAERIEHLINNARANVARSIILPKSSPNMKSDASS